MHATRVVTFLLGAWILGTLCVDVIAYKNFRLSATLLEGAPPAATSLIRPFGEDNETLFLRYFAAESGRQIVERWQTVAIVLGVILIPTMFFAVDRKLIPTVMAAFLLALALFQSFSVNPELAYRTRQIDFPPGRGSLIAEEQARGITRVYVTTDGAQVFLAALLAIYVMTYRSRRRTHSRRVSPTEIVKREVVE